MSLPPINKPRILAVDDDATILKLYRLMLGGQYDVETVASGEMALLACSGSAPDVVLLDMGMPGLDGFETCRRLRDAVAMPIIFVTGRQDFEDHLRAYDAGATDIVTKPFRSEILLRKIDLAIRHHLRARQLVEEKASLQQMAMSFLSSIGENGTLLNFMRASVGCRSYQMLAEHLVAALTELGVTSCVQIRHRGGPTCLSTAGGPTMLECSILDQVSGMGRIFQFHQRLVVNYDHISILVSDMPRDASGDDRAGRLRDNIVVLAETCEGLIDNVEMRIESMQRAEQLQLALGGASDALESMRREYYGLLGDTRLNLQALIDAVERSFAWMGMNEQNEREFIRTIHLSLDPVLGKLAEGGNFERHFGHVLDALRSGTQQNGIELF